MLESDDGLPELSESDFDNNLYLNNLNNLLIQYQMQPYLDQVDIIKEPKIPIHYPDKQK